MTRSALDACLSEGAFSLAYQPILDLDTGEVIGVEVFCRFDDGTSPERRFQQAETLGMAADLDLAVIEAALADLPELPAGYLSINLSPSTLRQPRLGDVLLAPGLPADRIVIEVTERARIPDYTAAEELITLLRARGVRLAVDDAGAGYATLRHMLSLQPDFIKMDRSITQDVDSDTARHVLATALVTFSSEIGATVIAEGVETKGEILGLRRAGIHHAQGYVLGRPSTLPLAASDYEPESIANAPTGSEQPAVRSTTDGGRRGASGRAVMRAARAQPGDGEPAQARAKRKLHDSVHAVQSAESQLEDTVALARKAGLSWDDIAGILGVTRQGASKRFGQGRLH